MAGLASSTPPEINMDEEPTRVVEDRTTAVELEAGGTPVKLIKLDKGTLAEEVTAHAQDNEVSLEKDSGGDSEEGDGNMADDDRHGEEEGTAAAASAMLQLEIVEADEYAHVDGRSARAARQYLRATTTKRKRRTLGRRRR